MQRPCLDGRSILIVEDEPLIVMDITQAFEGTGAALTTTNALHQALILVEHDGLAGATPNAALHVRKPAAPGELVAKMEGLILGQPPDPRAKGTRA